MPVMELKGEDGLQSTVTSSMTREVRSGKYSKRRRSNVAVIHVRVVFIGSFLFYCLLLNHSFQTNPNSITNCFKLSSLLQLTTLCSCVAFLFLSKNGMNVKCIVALTATATKRTMSDICDVLKL